MQEAVDGRKLCNLQAQEANQRITTKRKLPEGIQCHLATSQFRKHVGFHIARGVERQRAVDAIQARTPAFVFCRATQPGALATTQHAYLAASSAAKAVLFTVTQGL